MKKILLTAVIALSGISAIAQTTATNFNVNDCSGANHDLFTELDAGKIIVIAFVMPCSSCIAPSLSAYTEVQNYASTYPGRVKFYLSDDVGTSSCTTITNWGTTNGMTSPDAVFCNTAVKQADYGAAGMPKIVVLGGSTHSVLFNQNNGLNVTNFNNAIMAGLTTGINENSNGNFQLSLFPNPVTENKITFTYNLTQPVNPKVEIYNVLGEIVKSFVIENNTIGKQETTINFESLTNGIYFIKLNVENSSQTVKFTVTK